MIDHRNGCIDSLHRIKCEDLRMYLFAKFLLRTFFSQPGVNLWLSCRVQAARLVRWHIGLSKVMLSIRGASGQGTGKYSTSVESRFTL